jgi:hypothetical protein
VEKGGQIANHGQDGISSSFYKHLISIDVFFPILP